MTKVSIVGGGIGGLAVALALKKANISFTIYEAASALEPVGAGITLAQNAMQAFRSWDIAAAIKQSGNRISVINFTTPRLEKISSSDLTYFEQQSGLYNVAIHRHDLLRIMADAVGREHIVFNKRLKQISVDDGANVLAFEDGSVITAEYVIGADGIHSKVRKTLFPGGELRDARQTCWRDVVNYELPSSYQHELNEAWGKGKRFGFVRLNDREVYWYFLIDSELADSRTDIFPFLDDFHPLVQKLIRATPPEKWITAPLFDLKPIHHWNRDNVCLIGDAAHATTPNLGQGACQAIEDASVLGELFQKYEIGKAFGLYPLIRKKKAHYIVNTSWRIGKLAHLNNPLAIALRNFMMKVTPDWVNKKQLGKTFAPDHA